MNQLFTVASEHFSNKMKAKKARDLTGSPLTKGPDHIGKHGHGVVNKKHRRNRKFS